MKKELFNKFLTILVFAVLMLLIGCAGGSTRGTGGIRVAGTVLDPSLQPIAEMLVTILQSGDQATTNSNGEFVIESETSGDIDLLFEKEGFSSQARLEAVPSNSTVTATFEADIDNDTVEPKEVDVKEDDDDDSDDDDSDNSGPGNSDDEDEEDDSNNSGSGNSDDDDSDDDSDNSGSGNSDDDDSDDDDSDNSGSGNSDDEDEEDD